MDCSRARRFDLASRVGWRGLALAGLVVIGWTAASQGQAITVTLIASAVALLLLDIWRLAQGGVPQRQDNARALSQRLERATALLDAVSVGLFLVDGDGRVRFANLAGRRLAGFEPGQLADIAMLGTTGAAEILALPPGGRRLIERPAGDSLLAWTGTIAMPEGGAERLVSLQPVTGELDAVQVAAWHRMTRVLAHEMMSSLTPIMSLAESLARLTEGAEDLRLAAAAATIARRSAHLIGFVERYRAVVDLPRPEMAAIDAGMFVDGIARLVAPGLADGGIGFGLRNRIAGRWFAGDAALLEQALLNLLKNAAEAIASRPQPKIELIAAETATAIVLTVVDNGPGMPPDQFEEMFVPFFTTKRGGAGIGLSLARQIALSHGGSLSVRAIKSGGLALDLILPKTVPAAASSLNIAAG